MLHRGALLADGGFVIVALMVGWLVAGLLLALLVGGAVRLAEARGDWRIDAEPTSIPAGPGLSPTV